MKLLKLSLFVIAIIAATLGSTFYFLHATGMLATSNAETVKKEEPAPSKPIFLPLDPFTVTLRGANTNRILYVEITLRLTDDKSREHLREYMPEVRNRIIAELTRNNPEFLQTNEGRERLSTDIAQALQAAYLPDPYKPGVSNVLFTAFVIQ
jgi:flagellar FliL protein